MNESQTQLDGLDGLIAELAALQKQMEELNAEYGRRVEAAVTMAESQIASREDDLSRILAA